MAVYLLAILQFALLIYDPRSQIPTAADRQAGKELIEKISRMPGEVLYFDHGYLPTLAGKASHAQACAVNDIFRADKGTVGLKLRAEIRAALKARRFSAVILEHPHWFKMYLDEDYAVKEPVFGDKNVFWPVTGKKRKNRYIYVPRQMADREMERLDPQQ
jgi:hypothetical protein